MKRVEQITISNIPEISAIYFALLQCGYDYYSIKRSQMHSNHIRSFIGMADAEPFFSGTRQNTCEVYPYWPRAAILETASFYLSSNHVAFLDFDAFRDRIMGAANIADNERDHRLWNWIEGFPVALSEVIASEAFLRYLEWEKLWLAEQNTGHEAELRLISSFVDVCISKYGSPVQEIQIVINPIKCVYSADYHLDKNRFIFCSGAFRAESVIHEFLHHVVHSVVVEIADMVSATRRIYPEVDESYYLSGEEYAVRALTRDVMDNNFPGSLTSYLKGLL